MKKYISAVLAVVIILSLASCVDNQHDGNDTSGVLPNEIQSSDMASESLGETTEALDYQTSEEEIVYIIEDEPEEYQYFKIFGYYNPEDEESARQFFQPLAEQFVDAFINKNTVFLSNVFLERSGKAFDFVNDLEFAEFELTDMKFDAHSFGDETHINGAICYFNITVEGGTDDIFTQGGREWELHLGTDDNTWIQQFSPKGTVIKNRWGIDSRDALFCYDFSNNMFLFETMSDFNQLKEMNKYNEGGEEAWFYIRLHVTLVRNDPDYDDVKGYTIEEFIEKSEYAFGITNIEPKVADIYSTGTIHVPGRGWWWLYIDIASEEYDGETGTVVINYFGDSGKLFIAKTMKYNIKTDAAKGTKIISTELLYSNDDLILATGSI